MPPTIAFGLCFLLLTACSSLPAVIRSLYPLGTASLARQRPNGYTAGMKTAISIPDKLYADAERFSRRRKKSRSRLYVEAVEEYLARHDADTITETMNQVCKMVDTRPDVALSAASRRTLKRVEW